MSTAVVMQQPGNLVQGEQQSRWTPEQITLLKNSVCKGANDDEFKIFCYAVQRTGLDPFMKQIHAVKRWNAKANREDMSIQVGIDGYRLIADRTGLYAGNDEPIFDSEAEPTKATVTVYKMVQGQRCPFTASARWDEYYPGDKQGFMWNKMPCVMLGKVAEALALRKAFPAELSGVYTNEEMEQAGVHDKPVTKGSQPILVQKPEESVAFQRNAEGQKIALLRTELDLSKDELKAEVHRMFGTDDFTKLSLDQVRQVTASLLKEKEVRTMSSPSLDSAADQAWMDEVPKGPVGGSNG